MSCGVGHRRGSDPTWLWLWHRPAATAPIRPPAWEPPYAASAAIEKTKKKKRKKERKKCSFPGYTPKTIQDEPGPSYNTRKQTSS